MGTLDRSTGALEAATRHIDQVHSATQGQAPAAEIEEVLTSWQRSATKHGVDPADNHAPRILTPRELKDRRDPLEACLSAAQEEINRLYGLIRDVGYVILFCDAAGVAIDHRGDDGLASDFSYWGTWLGGVWSVEEAEGTNGIGTCIADQRAVTIHRNQHYRSRHKDLSCSGAPIFDVDGSFLAVLDVSAIDPKLSENAHALTGVLTVAAARAIEERLFRERFRRQWIVALAASDDSDRAMLLAVDRDQRIIAADRAARRFLLLDDRAIRDGVSLWNLFARDPAAFRRNDADDIPTRLIVAGRSDVWPALLTPPSRLRDHRGTWPCTHDRASTFFAR